MGAANRLKAITTQVRAQFLTVTGTGYNTSLSEGQVIKGFMDFNQVDLYPTACVFASSFGESRFTDQNTLDFPFLVEVFGWVKGEEDVLMLAEEFAADMEKAIFSDESLAGLAWGLALRQEISALAQAYGGVYMQITGTTSVNK